MVISADTSEKYASKDVLPTLKIRAEAHTSRKIHSLHTFAWCPLS